jgi:hypothetical protein
MKWWVCRLQLLLILASAVILGSESSGTHDHILLSQIRSYLYPPGTRWPSYSPRQWVPFSSPPTTRRATVEVFNPASTRDAVISKSRSKSNLYYDRRSVGQSILVSSTHLGLKTRYIPSESCGFVDVGRPLWREDGSGFYNLQCTTFRFYMLAP